MTSTPLNGVKILDNGVFPDTRGTFVSIWQEGIGPSLGSKFQASAFLLSRNPEKFTLRGLHFQHEPYAQAKLVSCIQGSIYDVVLDLRPESSTFLKWQSVLVDSVRPQSIYVPRGCAHGFITLEPGTLVAYLTEGDYAPEQAGIIRWNDAKFSIPWPTDQPVLSEKDRVAEDFVP